jgi:hypothetical protein
MFSQETNQPVSVEDLLSRVADAFVKNTTRRKSPKDFAREERRKKQEVKFARIDSDVKDRLDRFLIKYRLDYKDWLTAMINKNCHLHSTEFPIQ